MKFRTPKKQRVAVGVLNLVIIALLTVVGTAVISGCQGKQKDRPIQYTPDSRFTPEYKTVFEDWTREDRIYKGFDCKLIAAATYKSMPFRRAYTFEYSKRYRLTEEEREKLYKDQEDAAATYTEFLFAAYVPENDWDDFGEKDSTWKIVLIDHAGRQRAPVEIRKLERNNVVLKHFFPYVTPWKSVYLLRFTVPPDKGAAPLNANGAGALTLSISSVLGTAEMRWDAGGPIE